MDPSQEIMDALRAGDEGKAREVLAKHPGVRNARAPGGLPLLHMAIYARAASVIDALLAAGVEPNVWEAAALGQGARVAELVAKEPTLRDAKGPDGAPALHLAAHFGREETVALLARLGAPLDAFAGPPLANTALHAACAGRAHGAVATLLAAGASVDVPDKNGYTPLMIAAANGALDTVRLLLASGASRDARAPDGKTAQDHATARGHADVVAALLG